MIKCWVGTQKHLSALRSDIIKGLVTLRRTTMVVPDINKSLFGSFDDVVIVGQISLNNKSVGESPIKFITPRLLFIFHIVSNFTKQSVCVK